MQRSRQPECFQLETSHETNPTNRSETGTPSKYGRFLVTTTSFREAGLRVVSIPPHIVPDLEAHLMAHVGPDPTAPLLTGPKGGRLRRHPLNDAWNLARAALGRPEVHFHDLRHAGLTWAATQGATTAELMRRGGHASPSAALRYQHATEDRDAALARALSSLVTEPNLTLVPNRPRDIRAMDDEDSQNVSPLRHRHAGDSFGAADQDRTGIISLEG